MLHIVCFTPKTNSTVFDHVVAAQVKVLVLIPSIGWDPKKKIEHEAVAGGTYCGDWTGSTTAKAVWHLGLLVGKYCQYTIVSYLDNTFKGWNKLLLLLIYHVTHLVLGPHS